MRVPTKFFYTQKFCRFAEKSLPFDQKMSLCPKIVKSSKKPSKSLAKHQKSHVII